MTTVEAAGGSYLEGSESGEGCDIANINEEGELVKERDKLGRCREGGCFGCGDVSQA